MLKCTDQTATVLVIIWVEQADIHTTVAISTSYNQTLTLGGRVKLACLRLVPAAHPHCCNCKSGQVFLCCLCFTLL